MKHPSPLRYPGGKASLTEFLTDTIDLNDLRGSEYFEPYAGGAGAALKLLQEETVSTIHINDLDPRIHAFWDSALNSPDQFIEAIQSVPLTIEEWHRQNNACSKPDEQNQFNLGFATFYMNRCNRSGLVTGAGPIGGLEQSGKWRLDVRFNRDELSRRIQALKLYKDRIKLSRLDAIDFLKTKLPAGLGRKNVFVYLDPPYVENGKKLYFNAYEPDDHAAISRYLDRQHMLPWLLSYDDTELIKQLYSKHTVSSMPIRYSLQSKRTAKELIISPKRLTLPYAMRHQLAG